MGIFTGRVHLRLYSVTVCNSGWLSTWIFSSALGLNFLGFQEGDGTGHVIEAVLIPVVRESGGKRRITLCVSSQVSFLKSLCHTPQSEKGETHFWVGFCLSVRSIKSPNIAATASHHPESNSMAIYCLPMCTTVYCSHCQQKPCTCIREMYWFRAIPWTAPQIRRAGSQTKLQPYKQVSISVWQVGCAMNCQFCLTGRMGLLANLTTAQIVEQVVEARRIVASEGNGATLTNLVFMGATNLPSSCCLLNSYIQQSCNSSTYENVWNMLHAFAPRKNFNSCIASAWIWCSTNMLLMNASFHHTAYLAHLV